MTALTYQGLNTKNVYLLFSVLATYSQTTGPQSYSIAKHKGASCSWDNYTPQRDVRALFLFRVSSSGNGLPSKMKTEPNTRLGYT